MRRFNMFCGCSCRGRSSSESEDDDHELVMESPATRLKANTHIPSEGLKAPRPAFKEVYESTPWLLPEHKIFISHSGKQKSFAGQLCIDLQRVGYFPFYDECGYCLPKGEKFPELLFKAAHRSLLAILLLSEDFFTRSKWPMQELATFVRAQESGHDIRILPVLLGLSLDDLRNPTKWIKFWEKWANQDPRVILREWVDAVPALKAFNSIVRLPREGEVDLRNRIVTSVMETMPPDVRSSVLHVQGRERICKEVLAKFTAALPSQPVANVKVLGMFGIGGAGKSTVCKLITEFMRAEFSGRVCHVELKPETGVIKLQCMVLRELMRDGEVFLENYITTEDKGRNRLEELMHRHKVFLALDNVSDAALSVDFAQFFLGLKFHKDSLIIVTSRSDQILCKQLGIPGSNCFHCPNLNVEEARDILLDKLNTPIECLNEVQKRILDETVERSFFGGYHPLALRLFAGQLGANPATWRVSDLDIHESSEIEHPLFSIIETSYKSLPNQQVKDMFLDIALFTPGDLCTIEEISKWLNDTVYHESEALDVKGGVERIKRKLNILRAKSLLEVWTSMDDETIRIHDLYRMLAEREASDRHISRFIYQRGASVSPTVLFDTSRARIIERAAFVEAQFEILVLEACANLQVLSLRKCETLQAVHTQRLRCLVSLELTVCPIEGLDLSGLNKLRWLHVSSCSKLTSLDASGLAELGCVNVSKCSTLRDVNMKNCLRIRSVSVLYNDELSFINMGTCQCLASLILQFCASLTNVEVSGLECLTIFKKKGCPLLLNIQGSEYICKDLKCMSLELWGRLSLTGIRALEIAVSLQVLDLWNCSLSRLPDLKGCLHLQELKLSNVDVLLKSKNRKLLYEYVRLLRIPAKDLQPPVNLEYIHIESCRNVVLLEVFRKLQGLKELRYLFLKDVRVGWDWELYRYTDAFCNSAYNRHNRMPSSGLGLEEVSTILEEVDEWSDDGAELTIEGGCCEDDKELIVLRNLIDTLHARLSKMGSRANKAKISDGEATPSRMRGVSFAEPAILEREALTCLSPDDVRTSWKGKHHHLSSESEVMDDNNQDETDAVIFLYKILLSFQGMFDVNKKSTQLEESMKQEFQSQLIKLKLHFQWETEAEPSNLQHEQKGELFWNYMDKAVRMKGSPTWIVEQIILATCCSCDSLCEIICQDQCTEPSIAKLIRELCQKIVVEEIRKQLFFLTALDCAMQQETFEAWESMVFREVLYWKKSSAKQIRFDEGILSTMPRLEMLVKRMNTLLKCRNWKFQSKLDSDDQDLVQVARDWLSACNLCLSIEQLRGFLARRNEAGKISGGESESPRHRPTTQNLECVLQQIQELLKKFDGILKTEMKKIPNDVVASMRGCDQKIDDQLFSLMRCQKVSQWLYELELCLSEHVRDVKKGTSMITQDYMPKNEMHHLASDIEEKLFLADFYCPEHLECRQGLTRTSVCMEELSGKAASLAAELKQKWPSTELLFYLLDLVNERKQGVLENVEGLCEKTDRFLEDLRMEFTSFASQNEMGVGWINDVLVSISQLKLKQLQCLKLARCSLDIPDAETLEELWQVYHQMEDWLPVCGQELWTSLTQKVLASNIGFTWDWIENLQSKLTEEIQYMCLLMCPCQIPSIGDDVEKTGLLDWIRKMMFLLTNELPRVKSMQKLLTNELTRVKSMQKLLTSCCYWIENLLSKLTEETQYMGLLLQIPSIGDDVEKTGLLDRIRKMVFLLTNELTYVKSMVGQMASLLLPQGTLPCSFREFVRVPEFKGMQQVANDEDSAAVSPGILRALVVGGGQVPNVRLDQGKPDSEADYKSYEELDFPTMASTWTQSSFPITSEGRLLRTSSVDVQEESCTLKERSNIYISPFIKLWDETNTAQLLALPFSQCVALHRLYVSDCRIESPENELVGKCAEPHRKCPQGGLYFDAKWFFA